MALLCIALLGNNGLKAQSLQMKLDELVNDTVLYDSEVGVVVYDLTADALLYKYQAEKLYRPASIQKVVTAITALDRLGVNHPFETTLYYTGEVLPDSLLEGDLYVVGGFDPAFGYDDMRAMSEAVRELGIDSISGRLIANVAFKDTLMWGSGWCWDDEMPPLSPLLYERTDSFLTYLSYALQGQGIRMSDSAFLYTSFAPDTIITQVYRKQRTLKDMLPLMMKRSDNLYAEAVFYHLAANKEQRFYVNADDAAEAVNDLLRGLGHNPKRYRVADGSGVSLYNYLSPVMLLDMLKYGYKHSSVFHPLYESLPIAGIDGTLRNRMKQKGSRAYRNVRAKTGTVTGVVSLAGYARAGNGHMLAFVLINQNVLRPRQVRSWQDRVCEVLCQ